VSELEGSRDKQRAYASSTLVQTAQTMMAVATKLKDVDAQVGRDKEHNLNPLRWNDE